MVVGVGRAEGRKGARYNIGNTNIYMVQTATSATGGTFTKVSCTKMLQIPVINMRRNSITLIGC